jgi:hypothetical protein
LIFFSLLEAGPWFRGSLNSRGTEIPSITRIAGTIMRAVISRLPTNIAASRIIGETIAAATEFAFKNTGLQLFEMISKI